MLQLKKFTEHHAVGAHKISDFKRELDYYLNEEMTSKRRKETYDEKVAEAEKNNDMDSYAYYKYLSDEQWATIRYAKFMVQSCDSIIKKLENSENKS